MTKSQKAAYQPAEKLKQIIRSQAGCKFRLDCGHHVTFGYFLGNKYYHYQREGSAGDLYSVWIVAIGRLCKFVK